MVERVEIHHVSGSKMTVRHVDAKERLKLHSDEWSNKPFDEAATKKWKAGAAEREARRKSVMRMENRHGEIGEAFAQAPSENTQAAAAEVIDRVKGEATKVANTIVSEAKEQAEKIVADAKVAAEKAVEDAKVAAAEDAKKAAAGGEGADDGTGNGDGGSKGGKSKGS